LRTPVEEVGFVFHIFGAERTSTSSIVFGEEKMPTSICPECDEEVYVDAESEQGDRVTCDECGTHLVVVGLDPIEMDVYEESDVDDMDDEEDFESYDYDNDRY
jgi:lysine biosynthesis protein LysW